MWRTLFDQLTAPSNVTTYVWLPVALTCLANTGWKFSKKIFFTNNKLINLGGGMILGLVGFVLILETVSYIFKGEGWIKLFFLVYSLLGVSNIKRIITYIKTIKFNQNISTKIEINTVITVLIIAAYSVFFLYITNAAIIGGDVSTYWAIAASFARGNYPIYSSWQPEFLISYHAGTSVLMGALNAISSVGYYSTHFFLSFYLILALFLFILGLGREYTRSVLSVIPAIMTLLVFGGPAILINGQQNLFQSLNLKLLIEKASVLPRFIDFVGAGGNCGASIGDFVFCNFRTFGTAIFLVFIFLLVKYRNVLSRINLVILSLLIIATLAVDESLMPAQIVLLGIYFLRKHIIKKDAREFLFESFLLSSLLISLFFIIQNPLRDSLLTHHNGPARFTLITKNLFEFENRKNFIGYRERTVNSTTWYLPNLLVLITISLVISFMAKSSTLKVIAWGGDIFRGY